MTETAINKILGNLYRITEAGEKGYATAATNTPNPGLKILFKIYAQQRAKFKQEILAEILRSNPKFTPDSSIPGMIHRGRVTIFAAMTIEKDAQEKVILKEVALGEKFAVFDYENALKANLPDNIRAWVEAQLEEIRLASRQIQLLLGQDGRRLIVHMENDVSTSRPAELLLKDVDFLSQVSQKISVSDGDLYQGKGATTLETVLSGAFGGALWGSVTGLLAGFGVIQTISPAPANGEILLVWFLTILAFLFIGSFIATGLSFFIGTGIAEDDNYQVREMVDTNPVLVQTLIGNQQVSRVQDKA